MQVKREIFEVLDENLLSKCSTDYWYDEWDEKAVQLDCAKAIWKAKTDNVYKKWKLYKARVIVSFNSDEERRLLTIED